MNLVLIKDVGFAVWKTSVFYLGKRDNIDKWHTFLNSVHPSAEGWHLGCEETWD